MRAMFTGLPLAAALAMTAAAQPDTLAPLAERYVRLVLAVGQHDADFVDAYYGPEAWKPAPGSAPPPRELLARAEALGAALEAAAVPSDPLLRLRREYLVAQTRATRTRLAMLTGTKLTFDEESKALYDAVAPTRDEAHYDALLAKLDRQVPGTGPLAGRVEAFKQQFVIPRDRLDGVFRAAVEACRVETAKYLTLPPGEQFTIEYVTGKPWSGYNWYQGQYRSLIQVNTDLPIFIDRALDLACHEGYPGHHVYNVLLEHHLVRGRGWQEFTVYPLFSPQSLIAEGTANYGIEIAFPDAERLELERRTLFPLAGLDPAQAGRYYGVLKALDGLSYAGNEAARRYLDGRISASQAADWLVTYTLTSRARAEQRVRFIDQYRSYVINYNLGKDLVRAHVERLGGTADRPVERWRIFGELLSSPRLPSGL